MSEIISGVYDATEDGLNILLDRSVSPAALREIRRIAEQLQQGKISAPQAKAAAEKISPGVGKLFDIANWSDQAKATLYAAIIGATAIVFAARMASSPNQTIINVQPVIERVIENGTSSLKDDLKSSSAIVPPKPPTPRRKPKPPR